MRCGNNGLLDFACGCFILEAELFDFFSVVADEARNKRLLFLADIRLDCPVLTRLESFNFEFALDNHA